MVKVKCTLVQALRLCTGRTAHRGSRGIALPFHDHGTRWGWGVSVTPRPLFTPGKTRYPLYRRLSGPQGRSGEVRENLAPAGIRSPDRPARSQSLYRLRYPAHSGMVLRCLLPCAPDPTTGPCQCITLNCIILRIRCEKRVWVPPCLSVRMYHSYSHRIQCREISYLRLKFVKAFQFWFKLYKNNTHFTWRLQCAHDFCQWQFFRHLRKIVKSNYKLPHVFYPSVCPSFLSSARYNSAPNGRIHMKFNTWVFFYILLTLHLD